MLTPLTAMNFVMIAYGLTLLLTIIVELHPRGRLGRIAAYASIVLVSMGGMAWTYAAFYSHTEWPEIYAPQRSAEDTGGRPVQRLAGRGREIDSEDAGREAGADTGRSRRADSSQGAVGGSSNGASRDVIAGRVLGLATGPAEAGDAISDCEGCPAMIAVPAGSVEIGADDNDPLASSAERPRCTVRVWPGYMISAEPVSETSYREFMAEAGRRVWSCGPKTAALNSDANGMELPSTLFNNNAAHCVMPGDADAYAAWLSARTGKPFRVPTAAQWEYAARILPKGTMSGGVAEIVADCWHAQIPPNGTERIASRMGVLECDGRMLKGAAATDEARWHRLSARRQIGARETRATIGFRVMRPLDGQN